MIINLQHSQVGDWPSADPRLSSKTIQEFAENQPHPLYNPQRSATLVGYYSSTLCPSEIRTTTDYGQYFQVNAFIDFTEETKDNGPRGPQLYNRILYIYPVAS
jgi:hypothetical protein